MRVKRLAAVGTATFIAAMAGGGAGAAQAHACVFSPPWSCGIGSGAYHEHVAPIADPDHDGPFDAVEGARQP